MCPNCIRGLKDGELCQQCAGTGFWNPASLSVKEVTIMADEQEVAAPEVAADPVETPVVEAPTEDAGVQVAVEPEVAEDQVNG